MCVADEDIPVWKKAGNWICGIEKMVEGEVISDEEKAALEAKQINITERPILRTICNINAVLLMTFAVFVWGFFA